MSLSKSLCSLSYTSLLLGSDEESGWKVVNEDVFRLPATLSMLLSVFAENGVQLICVLMSVATLTFTMLGILSPKNRGSLKNNCLHLALCLHGILRWISLYKMQDVP
jgi:hypothetical protein